MKTSRYIATAGLLLTALCGAQAASAAEPFTLSSSSFKDGGVLPQKHGGAIKANANCLGENVSPQLSWSGVPEGTKSFALVAVDPQGRGGLGVDHLVVYGIAPTVTGFAEGELSAASDKYVGGKASSGLTTYSGPCTPAGAPHHYNFTLIGTDLEPKALPAGLTSIELMSQLNGHAKSATGLVGLFSHP
jgi:Raf kinase inhibitor-like YbhB/YbcL family protein